MSTFVEENLIVKIAEDLVYVNMVDKNENVKSAEEPLYVNTVE